MNRIINSLLTIGVLSAVIIGGTMSFFSDTEVSVNNTFTAGTIDVSVNEENPWTETFIWDDVKPAKSFEINLTVKNVGENPAKIWKSIKNVVTQENGIIEPEQEWYDEFNGGNSKDDIDTAIVYQMEVDGVVVIDQADGTTISDIKDTYLYLGELAPDETMAVEQTYLMNEDTENWAQSDQMIFEIEILAQQLSAPDPSNSNENDDPDCTDNDGDGYFVEASGCDGEDGYNGHSDCNDNNPNSWRVDFYYYDGDDDGYYGDGANRRDDGMMAICYGADIPVGYTETSLGEDCDDNNPSINPDMSEICNNGLDDDCDGFVDCTDGDCTTDTACIGVAVSTIIFSDIGASSQYGYVHDYGSANASFTYLASSDDKLRGTIVATGLKPHFTYQLKIEGKPTCLSQYATTGDDALNGIIGYKGRWWNNTTNSNTTDSHYESGSGDCITGYLVWDYVTADEFGNVVKYVETANSYHVLWCSGGTCGQTNNDHLIAGFDPLNPTVKLCSPFFVNGEIERFSCNGLTLDPGSYDLQFILNEESFHQGPGTWTAVMDTDISFAIN